MAIVKAPALSLDASGNLGGVCYSKYRGLSIARGVWTGTVPNTSKQQVIQNYLTTVSKAWSGTLTDNQREQWKKVAESQIRRSRVDTAYIPTGYQYFMQLNIQVLRQGFTLETEPPIGIVPYGFKRVEGGFHPLGFSVHWIARENYVAPPTTFQAELWVAGPYVNGGFTPQDPDYRFIEFRILTTVTFISNPVNQRYYWGKYRWIEDKGRVGNWFIVRVFVDF